MSDVEFEEVFIDALEQISLDAFRLDEDDYESFQSLYQFVEEYAMEHQLLNTSVALPLVRAIMSREHNETEDIESSSDPTAGNEKIEDFRHALSVTRMLINLHAPLSHEEEDIMLAAAICHILPKNFSYDPEKNLLSEEYHLHPEIYKLIMMLCRRKDAPEAVQRKHFQRIQKHRLALLISLAGRGDLMGQLHEISSWSARRYIYETRSRYFPMCIYGKEHYPELIAPISVLTEKMRCLIEIAEILLSRYESRETELVQEILQLQEENARLKGLIQKHQG